MNDPGLFALPTTAILLTPGPTNTLLFTSGATLGPYRSLPLLLGELLGYLTSIWTIRAVLGDIVVRAPEVAAMLRIAAAIYLLLMAARLWSTRPSADFVPISIRNIFVATLLNPKAFVFALVIIPLRIQSLLPYMVTFAGICLSIGAMWIGVGALLRQMSRRDRITAIPRAAAVVLACFSLLLIALPYIHRGK